MRAGRRASTAPVASALQLAALLLLAAGAGRAGDQAGAAGAGVLDVPDAAPLGAQGSVLGLAVGAELARGKVPVWGLAPVAAALGTGRTELSLSMRDGGLPGDSRRPGTHAAAALKLHLYSGGDELPSAALQVVGDQLTSTPVISGRLLLSTPPWHGARLGVFAGAERRSDPSRPVEYGAAGGASAAFAVHPELELQASALAGPAGAKLAAGAQWLVEPWLRLGLSWERLPGENVNRLVLGIAFAQDGRVRARPQPVDLPVAAAPAVGPAVRARAYPAGRPLFRVRMSPAPARPAQDAATPAGSR